MDLSAWKNTAEKRYPSLVFPREGTDGLPRKSLFSAPSMTGDRGGGAIMLTQTALIWNGREAVTFEEAMESLILVSDSYLPAEETLILFPDGTVSLDDLRDPVPARERGEFGRALKEVQALYLEANPLGRKRWVKNLQAILAMRRSSFHETGLPDRLLHRIMEEAEKVPELRDRVLSLQAEEAYRKGERAALSHKDHPLFHKAFISDLSDIYQPYLIRRLIGTYHRLKARKDRTPEEREILIYLAVRAMDDPTFERVLSEECRDLPPREIWTFLIFRARYKNERMNEVLSRVLSDKPFPASELTKKDALGLSALHYAIIGGDPRRIMEILSLGESPDPAPSCLVEADVKSVLDFGLAAVASFGRSGIAEEVILQTSSTFRSLSASLHSMDFHLEMAKRTESEKVEELTRLRDELSTGMERMLSERISQCEGTIKRVEEGGSPLARLILSLYRKKDLIYSLFNDTVKVSKVYRDKNLFFVLPKDFDLPYSYVVTRDGSVIGEDIRPGDEVYHWDAKERASYQERERREKKKKEERDRASRERRREDTSLSWFSKEAMEDESVLKKEYHALVKRYHPDAADTDTTEVMQEIQEEKDAIEKEFHRRTGSK